MQNRSPGPGLCFPRIRLVFGSVFWKADKKRNIV